MPSSPIGMYIIQVITFLQSREMQESGQKCDSKFEAEESLAVELLNAACFLAID
jgi:hypothetical protein